MAVKTWLFTLFDTVVEFLEKVDNNICDQLRNHKKHIAFLTDLFEKLNEVSVQLQGDYINMIKVKSVISSLLSRLDMFRWHIGRKEFIQFPRLKETNRKSCWWWGTDRFHQSFTKSVYRHGEKVQGHHGDERSRLGPQPFQLQNQ